MSRYVLSCLNLLAKINIDISMEFVMDCLDPIVEKQGLFIREVSTGSGGLDRFLRSKPEI